MNTTEHRICGVMGEPSPNTKCVHAQPANAKGYIPCGHAGEHPCMFYRVAVPMQSIAPNPDTDMTDLEIIGIAYDCNAMPESCTDASLITFARTMLDVGEQRSRTR